MEDNTSNLKKELENIDKRIEHLKANIELARALEDLHNDDEPFKKVFLDGYFGDEANRLCEVLLEPSSLKRDVILNINDKISSIRNLKQFFGVIHQNAIMAPDQIIEEEEYRKKVTAAYSQDTIIDTSVSE